VILGGREEDIYCHKKENAESSPLPPYDRKEGDRPQVILSKKKGSKWANPLTKERKRER